MKRARYLVFFELCFVGLWCLAAFLVALFTLQSERGLLDRVIAILQFALTFATLLVTHVTLRTVFRRGSQYDAAAIATSPAFRAVPVVVTALGLFHVLLVREDEFLWTYTLSWLMYVFVLALGWHVLTAWLLARAPAEDRTTVEGPGG